MKIFDKQDALARVGEDTEFFVELLQMFFSGLSEQLQRLEKNISTSNFADLGECAHSLKGSLGNLGASRCQNAALLLERLGKSGGGDANAQGLLEDLKVEIEQFRKALEEEGFSY